MQIKTWNKLWSRPEQEQQRVLARSTSIHPNGRSEKHRQKNRARAAKVEK